MRSTARTLGIFALALLPLACAAPEVASVTEDASQFKGAKLVDESGALTIYAQLLDGKKPATKNQRYAKVSVKRGTKWASFFCSTRGELAQDGGRVVTMGCATGAETVSNDDDESLGFDLRMTQKNGAQPSFVMRSIEYYGDGTFLGEQLAVLVGDAEDYEDAEYALKAQSRSDAVRDPFSLASFALDGVGPLLGSEIYYDDVEANLKVRRLSVSLDENVAMLLTATLSKSGDLSASSDELISLLAQPGVLANGYASADEVLARAKSAFADATPAPLDYDEIFGGAFTPLGGPERDLAREVALEDVPEAVRANLATAGETIEARTFEDTDYQASVQGYYAVYGSADATDPVGYAVWGTGAGEPDYHDGIVIGFDLEGNEVYSAEDSG